MQKLCFAVCCHTILADFKNTGRKTWKRSSKPGYYTRKYGCDYIAKGQYSEAEPLLLQAIKETEAKYGRNNSRVLLPIYNLCLWYAMTGQWKKQFASHKNCEELNGGVTQMLPALSEREQIEFLSNNVKIHFHFSLSLGFSKPETSGKILQ
jgi:hypothetical protein